MTTRARAVRITEFGGPEVLQIGELEVREPGPHEILVEVAAAGVNRADLLQRRGLYPAPAGAPADVPGLEYAGEVAAVGAEVTRWGIGDRVMGIVGGGGMASHLLTHEREAIAVPDGMAFEVAAAIPEVFMTAFDALFVRGRARMGEWVLVHAAASGVGTAALQLARASGLRSIGTSRTADKLEKLGRFGLERTIEVGGQGDDFAERVRQISDGGVDVILDFVGAPYLRSNLEAAAVLGRIVVIGLMGGAKGDIDLGLLLRKRLTMTGTVLRARALEEKAALARRFEDEVVAMFESGRLEPVIDSVLPMAQASAAHRQMEENRTFGKLVLAW